MRKNQTPPTPPSSYPRREFLRKLGWAGIASWALPFQSCRRAASEAYPNKPIRLMLPQAPGGGTDIEARTISSYAQKYLKEPLVVENEPAADGRVVMSRLYRGTPDGYTIGCDSQPSLSLRQYLFDVDFDAKKFSYILAWSRITQVLVCHVDRWQTFPEFLDEARKKKLSCGLPYIASVSHFAGILMADALGMNVTWIPFGSSGPSLAALMGKHMDFAIAASATALPMVQAKRLRPLLVFSEEPDPTYPGVPIPSELGYNFTQVPIIRGAFGPPGLPDDRKKILEEAFASAAKEPEFLAWAQKTEVHIRPLSSEAFTQAILELDSVILKYLHLLKQS
ncbi:MAG: tripartite tricarboxylate transporter substrate binding protein [Acidobacteria bacterium]|nr:tripartite tricarboxylate transporter substrate binding protein [Acidobacteriota bacterium]